MNIKQRFISILITLTLVLVSGCATVDHDSNAPMEREDSPRQEREEMAPSPSIEMGEVEQQKKNKGSDDMERLD